MPKKVEAWKCNICGTAYFDEEITKKCEEIHALYENLEIAELREFQEESRFPKIILVQDKTWSGRMAQYKLDYEDSVEGFYEDEIDS